MTKIRQHLTLYEKEKALECAMMILPHAEGWTNRLAGFDPVKFSLHEAKRLIIEARSIDDIAIDEPTCSQLELQVNYDSLLDEPF